MKLKSQDQLLAKKGYKIDRKDLERPWGGFWVIGNSCAAQFIDEYFPSFRDTEMYKALISPKILFVKKGSRLSWQYHHRRSEIWQVVEGEVGVVRSQTDKENEMIRHKAGDFINIQLEERHRLIGLDKHAVIAEIWLHSNPENLSDEEDIVRVQDDFGRGE